MLDHPEHHGPPDDELLARFDADGRDPDGAAFIAIWSRHRVGGRPWWRDQQQAVRPGRIPRSRVGLPRR